MPDTQANINDNARQPTYKLLFSKKYIHMTLLGFSAGIPLYLIFSSLSLWLDQVGVAKSSITMFSWAALGYSFKFLWSPLVDKLPLPFVTKIFGQRRGWLLVTQSIIIIAIVMMSLIDPSKGEYQVRLMAFAAVLLGFSAATQDILIDAWRIEASNEKDIAVLSSLYIVGYRIGMITSGAGALYLAHYFGTSVDGYEYKAWQFSYLIMAMTMLVGFVTTLFIKEPSSKNQHVYAIKDYLVILLIFIIIIVCFITFYQFFGGYKEQVVVLLNNYLNNKILIGFLISFLQIIGSFGLALFAGMLIYRLPYINKPMIQSVYVEPIVDLFRRHKSHVWLLIGIISTYRISDIVMGVSANLFYQHMGFDLGEIASIVKTFGLIMTLSGGLLGGVMVMKFGVLRIMIIGAVLSAVTNILFMIMAESGKSIEFLVVLISADNLSAGLAMAAFIGFLSMLVNKSFTAVQYAMFSSVMTLFPKILGGFSGGLVEAWGFSMFFLITALIGIPVILMLIFAEYRKCFSLTN